MRKQKFWFPTCFNTNQGVQSRKMARGLKFRIKKVEGLYNLCSENKGTDQLWVHRQADLRLCFCICKMLVFSCSGPNILHIKALSPIGRITILTYLILGFLGAAIFDCIIRSCDLFYWFIRTCLGPTVVPAAITSLELFCVLTMCYFSNNVSSKENIKMLWLLFMFYYSDISYKELVLVLLF